MREGAREVFAVRREYTLKERLPFRGELHDLPTPVCGVGKALNKALEVQAIDDAGECALRDERLVRECLCVHAGRVAQGGQHVELCRGQPHALHMCCRIVLKRLFKVAEELRQKPLDPDTKYYTGFEVYNVNHYDIFRNPVQAKELLIEALEVQKLEFSAVGLLCRIMFIRASAVVARSFSWP